MPLDFSIDLSLHPRLQSTLIGHNRAVESLERALENKSLPQAWIFFGPKGVGKATCAYQFSRRLFKEDSPFKPDFVDRQIRAGTYPNFLLIEKGVDEEGKPKNNITIDDIRKINDFIHRSAPLPGWRLILIDGAEEMNRNAANALLKALEEPPERTLFILISHRMGQLLPTIKSRCCCLPFAALQQAHMQAVLSQDRLSGALNTPLPSEADITIDREIALEMAQGSLGRLYDLTQFKSNDSFKQIIHLLPLILKGEFSKALEISTSFEKGEAQFSIFLATLDWVIYQLSVLSHSPKKDSSLHRALSSVSSLASPVHWLSAAEKTSSFLGEAKQSHLNQSHILMACFYLVHSPYLPVSCE